MDQSSKVAINVLEALRIKGLSQKDLAAKMNVSAQQINKIIKGKQNLTFETVAKLEDALEISLMEIIDFKSVTKIEISAIQIKFAPTTFIEKLFVGSETKTNLSLTKPQMRDVHKQTIYSKSNNLLARAN